MKERENIPKPNFFSILPASVRYNPELSANAKLMFSEISALTNKEGFCWANNSYFMTVFNASKRAVNYWINELKNQGFVKIEVDKENGNARKIYCLDGFVANLQYLLQKSAIGSAEICTHNNINNNIYTSRARARETSKADNKKINFSEALNLYGYCQQITPARDLWDSLPAYVQEKILEHIPLYVKNHEENGKRNFLPDFFKYLKEERYNAPSLPYQKSDLKPGEIDKSDWKMWPDGILRPPDVKRSPEGIYYHEGTNQPYIIIPKNPYK